MGSGNKNAYRVTGSRARAEFIDMDPTNPLCGPFHLEVPLDYIQDHKILSQELYVLGVFFFFLRVCYLRYIRQGISLIFCVIDSS